MTIGIFVHTVEHISSATDFRLPIVLDLVGPSLVLCHSMFQGHGRRSISLCCETWQLWNMMLLVYSRLNHVINTVVESSHRDKLLSDILTSSSL